MTKLKITTLAAALLSMGMGLASTAVVASDDDDDDGFNDGTVIKDPMPRRAPDSQSGSDHTVEVNCFGEVDTDGDGIADTLGTNHGQDATASLNIEQEGTGSGVTIKVKGAIPNTHFTVWMRIKGGAGFNDLGSPWTGGGATPLCSGTEFADLNGISPWNDGGAGDTAKHCNSFYTDSNGNAKFKTSVNFPVVGGAYPFQQSGGAPARPGHDAHADVPTAIVDPRTGNGGPFMIRVISHCLDNSNHGLSPYDREAWFQYP